MPRNIQLLKQVRTAITAINNTSDNPEHKALLAGVDIAVNELMLQDNAAFYLGFIARGNKLLDQGVALLMRFGLAAPTMTSPRGRGLDANARSDVLHDAMDLLQHDMTSIVSRLDEGKSVEVKAFLVEVCDWEASLLLHRQTRAVDSAQSPAMAITADALLAYLQKKFPQWKDLRITRFVSLDGGFSKKTIMVDTCDAVNGAQSMVIRAEQAVELLTYAGADVTQEFHSIHLMRKHGLPTAEPLWLEADKNQLGWRFIMSRRAPGRTWGGNMGSNETLSMQQIDSIVGAMIRMHSIEIDRNDTLARQGHLREWLSFDTVTEATYFLVNDYLGAMIRKAEISIPPQMMRGLNWLRANIPVVDEKPVVIHLDFALNNLLLDEHGVTAILDWESSRIGDPVDDVVWTQENLGQHISMPDMLARYRAATGRQISEYRIAYARIVRLITNLVLFQRSVESVDKFDAANINLCIIGIKYPGHFATQLNTLIDAAEKAKGGSKVLSMKRTTDQSA